MNDIPTDPLRIGPALTKAFETIGRNARLFIPLALVVGGVPGAVAQAMAKGVTIRPEANITLFAVSSLIAWIGRIVLGAVFTAATLVDASGERPRLVTMLASGARLFLPLLAIFILMAIGLWIGALLLIVPFFIAWAMWAVTVPAYVAERDGIFAAFGRSRTLTKGARWRVLLLLVVIWFVSAIAGAPTGVMAGAAGLPPLGAAIIGGVVAAAAEMVQAVVVTALYLDLREWKEGASSEQLEAIFA